MVRVAGATLTTTGVGAGGSPEPGASAASRAALITSMPGGHREGQGNPGDACAPQLPHMGWRTPPEMLSPSPHGPHSPTGLATGTQPR